MRRKTPVLIAVTVALAALAACVGEPTPTPPPTTEASVSATPTPTPTPSPTPTGPVRFSDDPNWTANQLAAVQTVDQYVEVTGIMKRDPDNADLQALLSVAAGDQHLADKTNILRMAEADRIHYGGFVTPVERTVLAEATVDGGREIVVRQCQQDAPDLKIYQGGVEQDTGSPRVVSEYVVRWIEEEAGWRVVLKTQVSDSC